MRRTLIGFTAVLGLVAAGLAVVPARADAPAAPGTSGGMTVTGHPLPPPPAPPPARFRFGSGAFLDAQREAVAAHEIDGRLQQDIGAVHPGEDALGTGTSLTH